MKTAKQLSRLTSFKSSRNLSDRSKIKKINVKHIKNKY